jgi:hypothetical protein
MNEEQLPGYDAGRRDARLDDHDVRLEEQRRAVGTMLTLQTSLAMQVQRLGDAFKASAEATVKLAEGVKAERDNAREALALATANSTSKWTKRDSIIAGFIGVLATAVNWIAAVHK